METVLLRKLYKIQNTGRTAFSVELDELEFEYEGHLCEDVQQADG